MTVPCVLMCMRNAMADLRYVADPTIWGYQLAETGTYIPDPNAANEPVKLFLIGALQNNFKLIIPEPIKEIVEVVSHLNYKDFYHMVSSM